MADDIELDQQRRQEILAIEAKLSSNNHFEVLGIENGAPADRVMTAFRELSKKFHPDRYFGKKLGPYKEKLDRIFQRLTEAKEAVGDDDRRAAYLAANPQFKAMFRSGRSPVPKSETALKRDEERRRRLASHPYLSKATQIIDTIRRVKDALAKGEHSQAFSLANQAAQADPLNVELKGLLAEARQHMDKARGAEQFRRATDALNMDDEAGAIAALKNAVSADSSHHEAAYKLTLLLDRRGANPRESSSYAQKAVEAQPDNADYRALLGRLLEAAGMKAMAKKHLEEAERLKKTGRKR